MDLVEEIAKTIWLANPGNSMWPGRGEKEGVTKSREFVRKLAGELVCDLLLTHDDSRIPHIIHKYTSLISRALGGASVRREQIEAGIDKYNELKTKEK